MKGEIFSMGTAPCALEAQSAAAEGICSESPENYRYIARAQGRA